MPHTHTPLDFYPCTVAEILAGLGSLDAAMTFLLPRFVDTMREFATSIEATEQNQAVPAWPRQVLCMSVVKGIYDADKHSARFVAAFIALVANKVERVVTFGRDVQELGNAPVALSAESRARLKDPSQVSAASFYNGGEPRAALPQYNIGAEERDECNKKVCSLPGAWRGDTTGDHTLHP